MKRYLTAIAALLCASASFAQDYKYLTVKTSSEENSIELASIQKITFDMSASLVVVTTSEGQVKFPQSEMQKMFFSDAPTAIESLPLASEGLRVEGKVLKARGRGLLRIYNSAGALQRMAKVEGDTSISLDNLVDGVYIINLGDQTIKVRK